MAMKEYLNAALYTAKKSAIREFAALAAATPGCVSLTLGEPDFDTPAAVKAEVGAALARGETHYINNNGAPALRAAVAEFENRRNGADYTAEEVIVTAGATEALFVALFGILNPGDEVIVPMPAFVLYEQIVNLCRGVTVPLDTSKTGFQIDADALAALVTPKTKAIVLNSPNNPTGCVYTEESLRAVRSAVAGKPIFVICDDVYRDLIYTDAYHSFAEYRDLREQILLVQSYSKPFAMTGWRMGYLISDASVNERLRLAHQFNVVSTPAPFQSACITALSCDVSPMRETYDRRRKYALSRLRQMGLTVTEPLGAFYLFPDISAFGLGSFSFCEKMVKEALVAATPGACFGADGHIRISYACGEDVLETGLDRMEAFLK